MRRGLWIAFFVTPGLLIVFTIVIVPLFGSLLNSFFKWNGFIMGDFIGLENFRSIFIRLPYKDRFFNAVGNNIKWFMVSMFIQNSLGMLFGYALSKEIAGANIYKKLFFVPVLFAVVAVGFLWKLYLNPRGIVNTLLRMASLNGLTRAWLGDINLATYVIIAVNIWRWLGFPTLVFMSAFDNVPRESIEAAIVEGASEWKIFWNIMLPLIRPAILVIVVLTLIGSLNVFPQVYIMAGLDGGPYYSTDTIGTLFYRTAFGSIDSGNPQIGVGSAIGVVIYIATFLFSLVSILVLQKKETEL
jgi:raffinose/stachyose/melibiose transport system permease protein